MDDVDLRSFLGGRVALTAHVGGHATPTGELIKKLERGFRADRRLRRYLAGRGGKRAAGIRQLGKARLDPGAILETCDREDLEYLRGQLGWDPRRSWEVGEEAG